MLPCVVNGDTSFRTFHLINLPTNTLHLPGLVIFVFLSTFLFFFKNSRSLKRSTKVRISQNLHAKRDNDLKSL